MQFVIIFCSIFELLDFFVCLLEKFFFASLTTVFGRVMKLPLTNVKKK